jgi:D-alanyl-lipoteichoic acid acyltransferase DltB (MBOAT superfamily)
MLGTFKYYDFFAESLQAAVAAFGWHPGFITLELVLPVGISFYTFQTLSYTIDIYRRQQEPTSDFLSYLTFVSFFPQLVAGPIERAGHLLPQLEVARRFDPELASDGCRLMAWGFVKKLVIADRLAVIVDAHFSQPQAFSGPEYALAVACFWVQVYGDFSGYSDIAIGTGRLFGVNLSRNFAYPLFARSLFDLWTRWHITLYSWLRDYVYRPLSRGRGRLGARAAVLATFTLSGLWHGAAWHFVVWGGLHGLLLVLLVGGPGLERAGGRPAAPGWARPCSKPGASPRPSALRRP